MLRAKDIMKYGVLSVKTHTPVYEAIAVMVGRRISSLPVVDNNMALVGIISEKDVLQLLYDARQGNVGDFMTENVIGFDQQDSLTDICHCFIKNHFRRVPILDNGKLVSVISRLDVINANKDKFVPNDLSENSSICNNAFAAKDAMTYGLFTVKTHTPIYEAVDILLKREITGLPVVDDYMNLVGVITEKDILDLLCSSPKKAEKVGDVMTEKVVCFNQNDSLFDICDFFLNNPYRRIMILDNGRLVGIISRTDIIEFILKNKTAMLKSRCPA
jgi:CBS domain-containing protein